MSKLRILIVEPSGLLWGSERALLDLLTHYDTSRYEVTVACPLDASLSANLRAIGIRVLEGDIGMLHRRGRLARWKALAWLAAVIRRSRPHVIHINEAGLTKLVGAARLGSRAVSISHVRLWDDAEVLAGERNSLTTPDVCIAISQFIANRLRASPATDTTRSGSSVRIIYDPFDADAFASQDKTQTDSIRDGLGLGESNPLVLMVGRVCREKGQALLLDAAEILGPHGATFLFAGGVPPDSPEETSYNETLLRRANSPALRDQVRFLGNRTDISELMRAADLVVLASANEPFGRVLLEALSLGKPVVAPDRGGPVEIIGDDDRGYLFKAGDARDLSTVIRRALQDPRAARQRTARGRQWVARECSPLTHRSRVQALWDEVSTKGRGSV